MLSIADVSGSTTVLFTILALFLYGVKSSQVDASDERYTMCCRLQQVPKEHMPLCGYTPLISAWRAMQDAGTGPDTALEKKHGDLIELWGRWNRSKNRTLIDTIIQCGRPKSVRGMGRCCAKHGVRGVCLQLCAELFDLAADTAENRHRNMECYNGGQVQVLETLIAGYSCLKETSK